MADEPTPYEPREKRGSRQDAAPKGRPASTSSSKTAPKVTPKRDLMNLDALSESLKEKWTHIGMGVYRYNEVDGLILIGGTDDFIDSMVTLAERNIRVRRVLDKMANAGEGVSIFLPMFNMANAIAANHGISTGIPLLASIDEYTAKAQDHVDLEPDEYDESLDADLDAT